MCGNVTQTRDVTKVEKGCYATRSQNGHAETEESLIWISQEKNGAKYNFILEIIHGMLARINFNGYYWGNVRKREIATGNCSYRR